MPKNFEEDKKKKPGELDLDVLGFSGLKESGGQIDEEFLPRLKGDKGIKTYREMADNSSTVGAILFIIEALVRQVEWRVEPAGKSEEALNEAEFLEGCLLDMALTWEDTMAEALSFLTYGWANFEVVYKLRKGDTNDPTTQSQFDDGRIGWRKIALRSQDTLDSWEFDAEDGNLLGMHQLTEQGQSAFIPVEKSILFRTTVTKDNPEGRSILRNAVIDYYYLKRISNIEAIGIERDMTGMIVMEVPLELLSGDASAEDKQLRDTFAKMLGELKRDEREFAMIPPEVNENGPTGYKLSLLSTGGSRQIDTNAVKQYYKTGILQSVLAQFIQLGNTGVGSFALASSQTTLFATALGSILQIIASTFNRFGVAPLMKLNGVARELWPELVHGDIETPPLAEIGTYMQALASAGLLPEDVEPLKRKLLEFARLPIPDPHEEGEGEMVETPKRSQGVRKKRGGLRINNAPLRGSTPQIVKG